ncbi:MAG: nitroreductase family protein [Candidatus Margulisbacteria bacterium]|nr:nitroreductase family protein [Candidatus Margulisiibacteriota bacterium]
MGPEILNIIQSRRSVRQYAEKPIEEDKLSMILESARLAPSASNSQPWHFYVVKDAGKIKALGEKMPLGSRVVANSFIADAPIVIVATAGPIDFLHKIASAIVNKKWYYLDVAIALEHMSLTAWELGIGSCWIGWFDEKKVKSLLNIPKAEEVIAFLTLGYPKEGVEHKIKPRKKLEQIMTEI